MANNTTTSTVKKVTKTQRNLDIMALLQGQPVKYGTTVEDAIAHLTHENDLLSRKNTTTGGKKKLTTDQKNNIKYKKAILAYLRANPALVVTANDIMEVMKNAFPNVLWSNQKAASLLNAMSDDVDKETNEVLKEGVLNKVAGKGKVKTTWQIRPDAVADFEDMEDEEEESAAE